SSASPAPPPLSPLCANAGSPRTFFRRSAGLAAARAGLVRLSGGGPPLRVGEGGPLRGPRNVSLPPFGEANWPARFSCLRACGAYFRASGEVLLLVLIVFHASCYAQARAQIRAAACPPPRTPQRRP